MNLFVKECRKAWNAAPMSPDEITLDSSCIEEQVSAATEKPNTDRRDVCSELSVFTQLILQLNL